MIDIVTQLFCIYSLYRRLSLSIYSGKMLCYAFSELYCTYFVTKNELRFDTLERDKSRGQ